LRDTDDEVTTFDGMVQLLKNSFGSANQKERFRAELRNRCRKPGETLQQLHQDIHRLFSLSYPGPTSDVGNIVARNCFLDALDDGAFHVRILERDPLTLDAALQIAVRLEAYDGCRGGQPRAMADRAVKPKEQYNRMVTGQSYPANSVEAVRPEEGDGAVFKDFGDSMRSCISQMTAFQSAMENQCKRLSQGGHGRQKQGGYKKNNAASTQGAQGVATSPVGNTMTVGGTAHNQPPSQQKSPGNKQPYF